MIFVVGGSGGLSPNSAVIHVTALAGSTISFAKGGVVAKVLGPDKSHVKASDSSLAEWYYAISPNNYGEWTVTATRPSDQATESKNVTVSENKQYDLDIIFKLYLFRHGAGVGSGYTYRVTTNGNASPAYDVNLNEFSLRNYTFTFQPAVDVTNYSVLNCEVSEYTGTLNSSMVIGRNDDGAGGSYGTFDARNYITGVGTTSLDITGYSGDYYVKFYGFTIVVTNLWLSR